MTGNAKTPTSPEPVPESFKLLKPLDPQAGTQTAQSPFFPHSDMYQEVFNNFPAGLAILSLEGEVLNYNPVFKYLTDFIQEAGATFSLYNAAKEMVLDFETIKPLLHYPSHMAYTQFEKDLGGENSRWVCLQIGLVRNEQQQPLFFVIECRDIQSYKAQLEQLTHQIMHDPLTGLGNRKLLEYEFNRAVSLAKRYQQRFALMVIDLDHFKTVNDTLGHDKSDYVIKTAATRLRKLVRLEDTVVRLGGDEFVILLHEVKGPSGVQSVAQKLLDAFKEPITVSNQQPLPITLSIGISIYPDSGSAYAELFKQADRMLYQVKQRGRNGFQTDGEVDFA